MAKKKSSLYLVSILLFMLVLPGMFITYQHFYLDIPLTWQLTGKWFLFWSVGVRLLSAGLKQILQPGFTAKEIFHFTSDESYVVIRELGFANFAIGLIGILSLIKHQWAAPAALTGGLYFGLAGITHFIKRPETKNEMVAMISDIFVALLMLLYLLFTF